MRQDDAVEAPVGAEVEETELAVGLSLGQCRLNVLGGVRALVVRALRARRGVRANGECQEGGQGKGPHTCLQIPTCGAAATFTAGTESWPQASCRRNRYRPSSFKGFRYPRAPPSHRRRRECPRESSRGRSRR